jgi:hypothetical protein
MNQPTEWPNDLYFRALVVGTGNESRREAAMLALIFFLILVYVAVGIIGFVVKGLFWLFIVAGVLFLITLFIGGVVGGRRSARRTR